VDIRQRGPGLWGEAVYHVRAGACGKRCSVANVEELREERRQEELREERRQEELKHFFEYFKHLTTLSVAVAIVILAIYREGIAKEAALYVTLALFGYAVLIAVFGMLLALAQFRRELVRIVVLIWLLVLVTGGLFGIGLLTFMHVASGIPLWLLLVVALLVVALLVLSGFYWSWSGFGEE
jgi:hypothetical protein